MGLPVFPFYLVLLLASIKKTIKSILGRSSSIASVSGGRGKQVAILLLINE